MGAAAIAGAIGLAEGRRSRTAARSEDRWQEVEEDRVANLLFIMRKSFIISRLAINPLAGIPNRDC